MISLLVHTFNQYERYWDGYLKGFNDYFIENIPCYWGTDVSGHAAHDFGDFKVIYSGSGEWSDRLIKLVGQIPTKYIFYMQEDQWPNNHPPNMEKMLNSIRLHGLWRLQLSPVGQYYSLSGSRLPLYFHNTSKYLVSHQPSIWNKEFLLSCLKANEDPWKNEYEGTKRLNNRPEIQNKIAIYPYSWFDHKSVTHKK